MDLYAIINFIVLAAIAIALVYLISELGKLNSNDDKSNEKDLHEDDFLKQSVESTKDSLDKMKQDIAQFKIPMDTLRRTLSGSSSAGKYGEWNLDAIISDTLPKSLFKRNWRPDPSSQEIVEIAVKLPDGLYLPIDAKFPAGLYQDYLRASAEDDSGAKERVSEMKKKIKRFIVDQSKKISKYITPGVTSNIGIMFLPSESVLQLVDSMKASGTARPLRQEIFSKYKILILGPNSLAGYLSVLNINFKRIDLNDRAEEVLTKLSAVETEFIRFKNHTDDVKRSTETLLNKVNNSQTRVNQMERAIEDMKRLSEEENEDH